MDAMSNNCTHHRWTAWFAVWCLLCAALVPGLNRVLPDLAGAAPLPAWLEVCTSSGMVRVVADADAGGDTVPHTADSCVWCCLHHGDLGLTPPGVLDVALVDVSSARWLKSMYRNAALVAVWQPSQSRAPPLGTALS